MSTDRRTFLAGAALAGSGALFPDVAVAAAPGEGAASRALRERVAGARRLWSRQKQDFLDATWAARPRGVDPALGGTAEALGDGLGAFATLKDLEGMPVEEQAHPAVQALLHDAAMGMGGAVRACRELLEAYVEGDDEEDPDRELHLRAALRSVRLGLGDWRTTYGRQRSLDQALRDLEGEEEPGRLRRKARRELARLRRAEALAERLAEQHERTGLLDVQDPVLAERFLAARRGWEAELGIAPAPAALRTGERGTDVDGAGEGPADDAESMPLPVDPGDRARGWVLFTLGLLVIGAGVIVGGFIALFGACAISCDGGALGVVVLLLGIAIVGVAIWGGVVLMRKGMRKVRGRTAGASTDAADPPVDELLGPASRRGERGLAVVAAERWVPTGALRRAGEVLVVRASGLVRRPGSWLADPDGNGVVAGPEALVRGAPVGALVGRVGADSFFVGRDGRVPDGADGELELAVNVPPEPPAKGHFVVYVSAWGPAGAGA